MRTRIPAALLCLSIIFLAACATPPVPLNSGRYLTPATQTSQDVGHFPINMILSSDGHYAITSDIGYYQSLWSIRLADGAGVSHIDFKNRLRPTTSPPHAPATAKARPNFPSP